MKKKEILQLIDKEIEWLFVNPHENEEFMRGMMSGLIQAKWIVKGEPHKVFKDDPRSHKGKI